MLGDVLKYVFETCDVLRCIWRHNAVHAARPGNPDARRIPWPTASPEPRFSFTSSGHSELDKLKVDA